MQREISSSSYVSTAFSHTSGDLIVILDFVGKLALFGTKFAAVVTVPFLTASRCWVNSLATW